MSFTFVDAMRAYIILAYVLILPLAVLVL